MIQDVGTSATIDLPDSMKTIDIQGSYILPGFMNAHIHSGYDANNLKEWAKAGVTSVRDVGNLSSSPEDGFNQRDNLMNDTMNARLVAAGPLVTTVGGYGNFPVTSTDDAIEKPRG